MTGCDGACCAFQEEPTDPHHYNAVLPPPHVPGPLVIYQAIGGRPAPYFQLPVVILHRQFLEPLAAQQLAHIPFDGELQRRIAEQSTAAVMARSQVVPMCGPWLEQYVLHPYVLRCSLADVSRCIFTGATTLFSKVDRGTHPPIRTGQAYSRARPSLYICLTAPSSGAAFFSPGYPIAITRLHPGDAILCQSVADEIFNYGPGEAIFLRLYGELGPYFPPLPPPDAAIDPRLLPPFRSTVEAPGSPLRDVEAAGLGEQEDVFGPQHGVQPLLVEAAGRAKPKTKGGSKKGKKGSAGPASAGPSSAQDVLTEAREALKEKAQVASNIKRGSLEERWDDNDRPKGSGGALTKGKRKVRVMEDKDVAAAHGTEDDVLGGCRSSGGSRGLFRGALTRSQKAPRYVPFAPRPVISSPMKDNNSAPEDEDRPTPKKLKLRD